MQAKPQKLLTESQRKSVWLFCTWLAKTLNEAGLDMRKVLKPTYNIPWTKENIHDHVWIPIQEAMYGTDSTKKLLKHEQIDAIVKVINRELGEKHSVEYLPFPVDLRKQHEKVSYGEYKELSETSHT